MLAGEIDDADEVSLADDSYTSASESTLLTIMETLQQQQQQQDKQMYDSCPDSRQIMSGSSGSDYPLNLSVDSLKEKSSLTGLHLPTEAITKQPIRKSDAGKQDLDNPFDRIKSSTIEPAPEPPIAKKSGENLDRSGGSEQYLMLTDSSCEETLMDSSSDQDNATGVAETANQQEQQQTQQQPLTASSYVKNMLAEAMSEKTELGEIERHYAEVLPRENSPISSER